MDRHYYSPYDNINSSSNYSDYPLYRSSDYQDQHEETPFMHQQWPCPQQYGNQYSNNFDCGWNQQSNYGWETSNNQGVPSHLWEPPVYHAMPEPPTMMNSTHQSPPSESDLCQLILKQITDLNAKFDERQDDNVRESNAVEEQDDSSLSDILERLSKKVEQFCHSKSEQPAEVYEPVSSNNWRLLEDDDEDEDTDIKQNPLLTPFGLSESPKEIEDVEKAEFQEDNENEESCAEGLVSKPESNRDQSLADMTFTFGNEIVDTHHDEDEVLLSVPPLQTLQEQPMRVESQEEEPPKEIREKSSTDEPLSYLSTPLSTCSSEGVGTTVETSIVIGEDNLLNVSTKAAPQKQPGKLEPQKEIFLAPYIDFVIPSHTLDYSYVYIFICDVGVKDGIPNITIAEIALGMIKEQAKKKDGNTECSLERRHLLPLLIFKENLKPD